MSPSRARDAARLIGKLDAEQWVELYGRDLVNAYLAQIDGSGDAAKNPPSRRKLISIVAAASQFQTAVSDAIVAFERDIGNGRVAQGRRLLEKGRINANPRNAAFAVRLYSAVRLAALNFFRGVVAGGTSRVDGTSPLASAIETLAEMKLPATATAEQRARLERALDGLRRLVGMPKGKVVGIKKMDEDDEPIN